MHYVGQCLETLKVFLSHRSSDVASNPALLEKKFPQEFLSNHKNVEQD